MVHHILSLPHEVLHNIIIQVNPSDLGSLCCCHALNDYIKGNRFLFQEVYFAHFDKPSRATNKLDLTWEIELPKLIKAQKILESGDASLKHASYDLISESIFHLLGTAAVGSKPSLNIPRLTNLFLSGKSPHGFNVETIFCRSFLYDWARYENWLGKHNPNAPLIHDRIVFTNHQPVPTTGERDEVVDEFHLQLSANPYTSGVDLAETFNMTQLVLSGTQAHFCDIIRPVVPNTQPGPEQVRIRQISAKLHCLYGVPVTYARKNEAQIARYSLRSDTASIHPFARSLVYDLRKRKESNFWGPFVDDGSQDVDWEKLEAIVVMLGYNIGQFSERYEMHEKLIPDWEIPWEGAMPYSWISPPYPPSDEPRPPLEVMDPYGITGTWMRVVCFLDYTELFSFNFSFQQSDVQPRPPLDSDEAFRLIVCKLKVTKIEEPGKDEGKGLPVVWFEGKSSSLRPSWDPNANSKIRGRVALTPEGEVRWTTWSIFHGEERWRSEAIQIGGVQSARGVFGTWFDKDFDEHGPAGPTCFWKYSDGFELCKGQSAPA